MLKEIFAIVLAVLAFEIIQAQSRPSVLGNTDPEKDRVLLQHGVHRKSRANTRFLNNWSRGKRQVVVDPLVLANPLSVDDPLLMIDPMATIDPLSPYYGLLTTENVGQILPFNFYDAYNLGLIQPMLATDFGVPPNLLPYAVTAEFSAMYPPLYSTFQLLCDDLTLKCFYYY